MASLPLTKTTPITISDYYRLLDEYKRLLKDNEYYLLKIKELNAELISLRARKTAKT